jgi:O-antigen ligase
VQVDSAKRALLPAWRLAVDWGWLALVVLLPITSAPLIVRLVGSSSVAAPSGLALAFLAAAWLLPYFLLTGGSIARLSLPLFGFIFAALLATVLAPYVVMPTFQGISILQQDIQALLTLTIGVCFYLTAATLPSDSGRIKTTLRWINWGGLALIVWGLTQAAAWYMTGGYPQWINNIQGVLSVSDLGKYYGRVSSFAAEPSWVGHQLNMLYLPLWLASTLKRYTAHRLRVGVFTVENVLLAGGVVVLLLTFSRVSLLGFMLMVAYLFLKLNLRFSAWLQTRTAPRSGSQPADKRRSPFYWVILAAIGLVYVGMLAGLVYGLSRYDRRMADMFNFKAASESPLLDYARNMQAGSRLVYWYSGWEVFGDHPWLGVGLGNAGYFLRDNALSVGWNDMEVREMMYRYNGLTNVKNLWVRILSETGLLGFAFFSAWVFMLWRMAWRMENSAGLGGVLGMAGALAVLALLLEGFSVDSFAMPYLWIITGLVSAAAVNVTGAQTAG